MADKKYSREQFDKMIDNQFAKHDVNADGELDKEEAHNLMTEVHGKFSDKAWNEEAFVAGFAAADVNKDGTLDKAELHAFLLARATERGQIEWSKFWGYLFIRFEITLCGAGVCRHSCR